MSQNGEDRPEVIVMLLVNRSKGAANTCHYHTAKTRLNYEPKHYAVDVGCSEI